MYRSLIALLLLPTFLQADDWPGFLGPRGNGTSSETGLLKKFPEKGPKILWSRDVGLGWSSPVVVGERAWLFHRTADSEVLDCVNLDTGKEIWRGRYTTKYRDDFGFEEGPRSTPVIAGKFIITLGADSDLTGWELATGKKLWSLNVNATYRNRKAFFGAGSSPIFVAGKILLNIGGKESGIVAFDPETGKELWKSTDEAVSYSTPVVARFDKEEIAVFFTRQGLLGISPEKGEVKFRQDWRPKNPNSVNAASPVVVGSRIFVSTSYNTGALVTDYRNGELKEVWKGDDILSCHFNTPVYFNEQLYGIEGRQEYRAKLRCIDFDTGRIRWTKDDFGCASLLLADGLLIALTESGDLVLIDPKPGSYQELDRKSIFSEKVRASMALSGGRLLARDGKKWLCIDLRK